MIQIDLTHGFRSPNFRKHVVQLTQSVSVGSKVSTGPDKVLTQWICFAILVWDGEDSDDGVTVLPQLLVNLLAKHTLTDHCDLHLHRLPFCRGSSKLHQQHSVLHHFRFEGFSIVSLCTLYHFMML